MFRRTFLFSGVCSLIGIKKATADSVHGFLDEQMGSKPSGLIYYFVQRNGKLATLDSVEFVHDVPVVLPGEIIGLRTIASMQYSSDPDERAFYKKVEEEERSWCPPFNLSLPVIRK